jgi:hypothetical protein
MAGAVESQMVVVCSADTILRLEVYLTFTCY